MTDRSQSGRPGGNEERAAAAERGEQRALENLRADELQPRRPERCAHGQLAGALDGSREQQVGEVGAGDEEHEAGEAEQHHEEDFALRASCGCRQVLAAPARAFVLARKVRSHPRAVGADERVACCR